MIDNDDCNCAAIRNAMGDSDPEDLIGGHEPDCVATNAIEDPERPHIVRGKFQSDKYPTCPPGKVPLSVEDPTAQDLLWVYAQRRRALDAQFADDLEYALKNAGYKPVSFSPAEEALRNRLFRVLAMIDKAEFGDETLLDELVRAHRDSMGWSVEDWILRPGGPSFRTEPLPSREPRSCDTIDLEIAEEELFETATDRTHLLDRLESYDMSDKRIADEDREAMKGCTANLKSAALEYAAAELETEFGDQRNPSVGDAIVHLKAKAEGPLTMHKTHVEDLDP